MNTDYKHKINEKKREKKNAPPLDLYNKSSQSFHLNQHTIKYIIR